jgi:hypothetical protein
MANMADQHPESYGTEKLPPRSSYRTAALSLSSTATLIPPQQPSSWVLVPQSVT